MEKSKPKKAYICPQVRKLTEEEAKKLLAEKGASGVLEDWKKNARRNKRNKVHERVGE
jgi:topoisomerase IA-like protein